jgi:spindle assembly abnormal protein 6
MIKELSQRVDGLDRQNIGNSNELNELRATVQRLTKEKHSTELKLAESVVSVDSQGKQLKEKDKMIGEAQKLVEHKETENATLQERLRENQTDKNKLDEKVTSSIAEINKGNDIISKLQKELLAGKTKADKY